MSARFVICPRCERAMLGQLVNGRTYPQPHDCTRPTTRTPEESPDE